MKHLLALLFLLAAPALADPRSLVAKTAAEVRTYRAEFSTKLAPGETLSTAACTATPTGLTITGVAISGSGIVATIAGGTNGVIYRLGCQASTSAGQILVVQADLSVTASLGGGTVQDSWHVTPTVPGATGQAGPAGPAGPPGSISSAVCTPPLACAAGTWSISATPSFTSVTATGLTAGRVVLVGTGGLLQDNAGLTFPNNATEGLVVSPTVSGDSLYRHAYADNQIFTSTTTGGYASYDAMATITGGTTYNHFYAFQARNIYSGGGLLSNYASFMSQPTFNGAGPSVIGLWIRDALGAGGISQYGIQIDAMRGGVLAFYSVGTTPSYHAGDWQIGDTAKFKFSDVSLSRSVAKTFALSDGGNLTVPAGGAAATPAKTGGVIYTSTTSTGNTADTNWDTLLRDTLPASVLDANGRMLRITGSGITAANGNTKGVLLWIGALSMNLLPEAVYNNVSFVFEATVTRTGSSAQMIDVFCIVGGSVYATTVTSATNADTSTIPLYVTAKSSSSGANDIVQKRLTVEVLN